jgi:HSF-type DNA-binding
MLMLMQLEKVSAKTGKKPTDLPMGWLDDGLAFVIRDKEKLVRDWLPVFFKQTKFASFTRKVRLVVINTETFYCPQNQSQTLVFSCTDGSFAKLFQKACMKKTSHCSLQMKTFNATRSIFCQTCAV